MSYGVIYKITNKENGECYIGKTIDPKLRWKTHSKRFNPENFTFEIIAKYKNKKDLDFMEKYWIWRFKAIKEGYNINSNIIPKLRRLLQIDFSETEWNMIIELKEKTTATSYADVIRGALLKYYKQRIEEVKT